QSILWTILKDNMKGVYDQTPDGWNEEDKRQEIFHTETYILLVRDPKEQCPVAFLSFRLDTECTMGPMLAAVVYCYEVQVAIPFRGLGMATRLLGMTKAMAVSLHLDKVMLTVFNGRCCIMAY
ncbi:hypothetical protein BJ684DRAFT_3328, partial [Piptocephalis cylindrospora]